VVSVFTSIPTSCWEKGSDEVRSGTGGILIVPRDRVPVRQQTCVDSPNDLRHDVTLRLAAVGRTKLFVRTYVRNSANKDSSRTIVRDLVVQ
jgi:hypothetical protein